MPLSTVIREKRKELGLTQEQIAERLGVSTPAVSKWESGVTYPDITLLSALARLLKADPNTLLCFQEEPSEQEISGFCREIAQILKEKGYSEGLEESCRFMKQKIREYPRCSSMIHTFALTLDGTLVMSTLTPAEKRPYEELALSWYHQVLESSDESLRIRSVFMLASKYILQGEYEKAQKMIDLMPEHNLPDKRLMQADLCLQKKENLAEAETLIQRKLLHTAMDLNGILFRLTKACITAGEMEKASRIAELAGRAADVLGLGEYFTCIAPLEIALAKQDVKESIRLIRALLNTCTHLWEPGSCPLYDRIISASGLQPSSTILPPLLASLERSPEFEFLRTEEEFQALLKHRKIKNTDT